MRPWIPCGYSGGGSRRRRNGPGRMFKEARADRSWLVRPVPDVRAALSKSVVLAGGYRAKLVRVMRRFECGRSRRRPLETEK